MADEITRTRHIGQVQPLSRTGKNPPRSQPRPSPRKKQRQPQHDQPSGDGSSTPRVDEYA